MDSKNIYDQLCESRKANKIKYGPGSGLHRHHIIPKHSGGEDDESNYTYLTVREHIISHYLLWRIYRNVNDLRSMHMLGANLSIQQRKIIGKWCYENKIGFHKGLTKEQIRQRFESAMKTQKEKNSKNTFYYWMSPEGRHERAVMGGKIGGKKTAELGVGIHGADKETRIAWGKLGGGQSDWKCMHKPGDKTYKRVKPENIQSYLNEGYVFGSTISPNRGNFKYRPVSIDGEIYDNVNDASNTLELTVNTILGRIRSHKRPTYFFCNEP